MDFTSSSPFNFSMRFAQLRVCGFLALLSLAHAQATWNFTGATTGVPASLPQNVTGGAISAGNAAISIDGTSASTGYTGASGANSASVTAALGDLSTDTSAYFTFTLTPAAGYRLFANGLTLGTRSTATGPTVLTLFSSADNFATPLASATVTADSTAAWALVTLLPSFSVLTNFNAPLTFRLYGSGGQGNSPGAGNWRIDDLSLSLQANASGPIITTQPAQTSAVPGATVNLNVAAFGSGTLTYQWRKGGVAIDPTVNPSAATATLAIPSAASADSGNYDVVVTDESGSTTSASVALFVGNTITLSNLSFTYNGNPHAATVTTNPVGIPYVITYNGVQNGVPTSAGTYDVLATSTDTTHPGFARATLTISKASQTISFNSTATNTPIIDVPFTVSATATSGLAVKFSIPLNANATASGTNSATITLHDNTPVTITATQSGNSNFAASTNSPTLTLTAAAPPVASPTPTATFAPTQTFDSLGTTSTVGPVPLGWRVFTGATAISLGSDITQQMSTSPVAWNTTTGNFRNVASATGSTAADSSATQSNYANRALGVRQFSNSTSNFGDPGASMGFVFSTKGQNVTGISFSAEQLTANSNTETWLLQAGVGTSPTSWTTLASYTLPGAFGVTPVTADTSKLGTLLNNQDRVWLRVVVLTATTLSLYDTFAIDDFTITAAPVLAVGSITYNAAEVTAVTVDSGQPMALSIAATGTGALTYQWRKNGVAIDPTVTPSAVTSTLSFATVLTTDSGNYDVVVNDSLGNATSTAVALTVKPIATTFTFSGLNPTYDGNPHPVTVTSNPPGATVVVTYTGTPWTNYPSTTTPPVNAGAYYVTATATDSEHSGSAAEFLVIGGAPDAIAPTISLNPVSQTVFYGDVVQFTVVASGTPAPVYQWRKNRTPIAGATNASLTLYGATMNDAGSYDVVIANTGGSIASLVATLTVNKRAQAITFDAPNTSFASGAAVRLNATASSGLPVSFSILSGSGTITNGSLTGRSGSIVIRAAQSGNANYDAAENVDRTFTFGATAGSGLAPYITSVPVDQSVNAGGTATFRVSAIGTPAPVYQWQKDGVNIAGATSPLLTLPSVALPDAGRYAVTATNPAGMASASAALVVRVAPVITSGPADQSVFAGDAARFSVGVTAVPAPTYQWRKNGISISGATAATLSIASAKATDAGRYDVVITNPLGSVTSAVATLVVTVRDFSGDYFGQLGGATGAAGDFVLHVRADGTAVFLGYVSAAQSGLVSTTARVDLAGNVSSSPVPVSAVTDRAEQSDSMSTAAAATTFTLNGTLDDATGAVNVSIPELGLTASGARAMGDSRVAQAGYYSGAMVGTATGRAYVVVASNGQSFFLTSNGTNAEDATTTLDSNGRLTGATTAKSALDLGFANRTLSGTLRSASGATTTIAAASESAIGYERLVNLSVRGIVAPGVAPLITGFVISGTGSKQVLIRAAGPAIAAAPFNVPGALPDPAIQVMRGSTRVGQNDNWSTPNAAASAISAAVAKVGAFPFRNGSDDAALLTTLAAGGYSVVVDNGSSAPTNGIALAEIYEALETNEVPGTRRLVNLSARGLVVPGETIVAGFVIAGTAPVRVLLRGVGPTLAAAPFNLAGTLANPHVTLYRGSSVVKTNDDWFRDADATAIRDAAAKVGAFALGAQTLDAAMLVYLQPGGYTLELAGPANANTTTGTGLAMIEIYEAP